MDLTCNSLPIERTLGIQWCIESDTFQFRIEVKDRPLTRRGILSTVSSVIDPLGLVSPYVLMGKQILRELVRDSDEWDEHIPDEMNARWERWRGDLPHLADIYIPRCYKDKDVNTPINVELHNFSDVRCRTVQLFAVDGQSRKYILCPSNGQIPCWPFKVCDHTASRADCSSIVSQSWQLLAEKIGLRGHHVLLLDGQPKSYWELLIGGRDQPSSGLPHRCH